MQRSTIILSLLAACLLTAQAQNLATGLDASKFTLFKQIAKCAGAEGALKNPKLHVTVLAPTNVAIVSFLRAMGISPEAALKNEALCDALLGYHVIPEAATSSKIPEQMKPFTAGTLLPHSILKFYRKGSQVTVEDAQGNKATVTAADIKIGNSVVHGVNKVLLSRRIFTSPARALAFHSRKFSTLGAALRKAGLLGTVAAPGFSGTVLAPTNKAFAKVPGALALPGTTLSSVLTYHVLPKAMTIPQSFSSGKSYPTLLKGQSVKYTLDVKNKMQNGKQRPFGTASFTSTSGNTATVLGNNIFAGKAVFHAIDAVLMPKMGGTAERGQKVAGRHLLQRGGGGGGADALDMAQESQMDAENDAIQWAAQSGSPADIQAATAAGVPSGEAVGVVAADEAEW